MHSYTRHRTTARRPTAQPLRDDLRHQPELRVSDPEREQVATQLREHGAKGRLDVEELEERLEAAYAARTRGDLAALVADLPHEPPTRPPRAQQAPSHELRESWSHWFGVSLLLLAIWAFTGADYFWPMWPIGGWGLALLVSSGFTAPWAGSRGPGRHSAG